MLRSSLAAWLSQGLRCVVFRAFLLLCLLCGGLAAQAQTVAAPTFSVAAGSYTTAQLVAVTDATAGSSIYYTTDGSTPTMKSFLYAQPIPIHQTLTINAIAVVAGGGQSEVVAATYGVSGVVAGISTIAGTGIVGYTGDGGPATTAQLNLSEGTAVDSSGRIYIADWFNNVVRKITTAGVIATVAGNGTAGFSGDGEPATSAAMNAPEAVSVDALGNLYIADQGNGRVRKVAVDGLITTFAGNGAGYPSGRGGFGDGGQATDAELGTPQGLALDVAGDLFIATADRIRKVTPAGIITTVAGPGVTGVIGDGGPATDAQIGPSGLAFDAAGNLYVADHEDCRIRKVSPSGIISTVAGNGICNYIFVEIGDGGLATLAELAPPNGVVVDTAGFIYISEQVGQVRVVAPTSLIETVAGNTYSGFDGDGAPASDYSLDNPAMMATDTKGNVYIADSLNQRVRRLSWTNAATQTTPAFGTMLFSPAAAVLQNASQAVTISDTLAYSGAQPAGAVAYVLNGVSYAAVCAGAASPETCSATVPAATIGVLSPGSYTVTGAFAGDANYTSATAASGTFTVEAAGGSCVVGAPGTSSMNIAYYTIAETDKDAASLGSGQSSNYVLPGLGPNGLPVYNPNSTSTGGTLLPPHDLLSDGELSWWSAALNNGGPSGTSDVVYTRSGIAPLPYDNPGFYPPSGTGTDDRSGFQAAVLTGNLVLPTPQAVTFTISSDDMGFVYLDGQIACDDGGVHQALPVPCTTSVLFAGTHTMQVFYVDLHVTGAVLDFSVDASNVTVGTINPVTFGPVAISPSATEIYGTNQEIILRDTLTYPGPQPAVAVTFELDGVSYTASCTAGGSPETCTANVPGAAIAALPGGTYPIAASFAGDCNYAAAASQNASFTITAAGTTTELAASATVVSFGQPLSLAATVSSAGPITQGSVSFYSGKTLLSSASLSAGGVATIPLKLPVGSYSFTATYSGSASGLPSSSSPPLVVTVLPAATSTTLTSSLNPAPGGSNVTVNIEIQSVAGTPAGSVTLADGGTVLESLPLNAGGTATYSTSSLAVGTHNLTAAYAANGNFAASQGTLTEIVTPPPTFTIAASGPLHLVTEHHGPVTITVTPVNGFSGIVTLGCGAAPQWATCEWGGATLSSTQLSVPGAPGSTQLVVDTSAVLGYESSLRTNSANPERFLFAGLAFPAMLLLLRRKTRAIRLAICFLALLPLVNLSGCSGMIPYSVAPGTYSIPIVGVSGTIQSSGTLTLVVTK